MSAIKKSKYTPGETNMEQETKRFNKRALIGSFIIHMFFFLIQFPELHLDAQLKDDPKLIPITMTWASITSAAAKAYDKNIVLRAGT